MAEGQLVPADVAAPGHTAYSSLVEGADDLVGLIAYSLYKSDKLAFLTKHHGELGRAPTPDELLAFCRTSTLPGPVSAYRAKATYLLQEMYDVLLDERVDELDKRYKAELIQELKKTHPFWEGVWQHAVAGIVVWAFVGLLIFVTYGQKIGWKKIAADFMGLEVPAAQRSEGAASAPKVP